MTQEEETLAIIVGTIQLLPEEDRIKCDAVTHRLRIAVCAERLDLGLLALARVGAEAQLEGEKFTTK